jgi:hypothetical protein
MTDYLLASKPVYLWLGLALPVISSLFLISKISDFETHFHVVTEIPAGANVRTVYPEGL